MKTGSFQDENGDGFAQVGETISYSFAVSNTGNVTLSNVTLSDTVGGVTISGGPIASLAVAATDSTTFMGSYAVTQADIDAGNFYNVATVAGTGPGGDPANDTDDDNETLPQDPSLSLNKTVDSFSITEAVFTNSASVSFSEGADSTDSEDITIVTMTVVIYSLTVTNDGNVTATGIALTDSLPAGLTITGTTGPATVNGQTVTWALADIAPGDSITVTVTAQN